MRPLSLETGQLTQKLWIRPGIIAWLARNDPRIVVIREIANRGEIAAIPALSFVLYSSSSDTTQATCDAIAKLLQHCSSEDYPYLDEEVRHYWARYGGQSGIWPRDSEFDFVQPLQSQAALWGMLSMHYNGRVRERAVRKLGHLNSEASLPFILLRLNDWVPQVRTAANEVLESMRPPSLPDAVARHLGLVLRLSDLHRADHSEVQKKLLDELFRTAPANVAHRIVAHSSSVVRRNGYRWVFKHHPEILSDLVRESLFSPDPVVRVWAIRDAYRALSDTELKSALTAALNDRSPAVRREVVSSIAKSDVDDCELLLRELVFDRNRSVRERARFYLTRNLAEDVRRLYREHILLQQRLPWSLFGLAETGTCEDMDVFISYSRNSSPALRVAAARGIGRTSGNEGLQLLLSALSDKSAKVSNEAEIALTNNARSVSLDDLKPLTRSQNLPHTRLAATRLIDSLDSWAPVSLLIQATAGSDARLAALAIGRLCRRVNRVWTKPNEAQRIEIDRALQGLRSPSTLPRDCYDWLKQVTT